MIKSRVFRRYQHLRGLSVGSQRKEVFGRRVEFFSKHGVIEWIRHGKYLVKFGLGYAQTESGPFILDLGGIVNRAMIGAKAGGAVGLVKGLQPSGHYG